MTIGGKLILTTFFGRMELFDISTPSVITSVGIIPYSFGYSYGFHSVEIDDEDIAYFNDAYSTTTILDGSAAAATIYLGTTAR